MNGKIKFFNEKKGFGFIIGEDNKDYFFHVSKMKSEQVPDKNQNVEFDTEETNKGLQAINVELM